MTAGPDDANVTYSVKEVLDKISDKVDSLHAKLDSKAEKNEVIALQLRMQSAEMSIKQVENTVERFGNLALRLEAATKDLDLRTTAAEAVTKYKRYFFSAIAVSTLSFIINALQWMFPHKP